MDRTFWLGLARDWGIAIAVAAGAFVLWKLVAPSPPTQGPAPDFTLETTEGETLTLSELQGQVVVLNFWATWCGPCRAEIPELARFHAQHPEVELLGISVDEDLSEASVAKIGQRLGITYPVLHDPTGVASGPYRVSTLPTTFVVDEQGQIIGRRIGAVDEATLEELAQR